MTNINLNEEESQRMEECQQVSKILQSQSPLIPDLKKEMLPAIQNVGWLKAPNSDTPLNTSELTTTDLNDLPTATLLEILKEGRGKNEHAFKTYYAIVFAETAEAVAKSAFAQHKMLSHFECYSHESFWKGCLKNFVNTVMTDELFPWKQYYPPAQWAAIKPIVEQAGLIIGKDMEGNAIGGKTVSIFRNVFKQIVRKFKYFEIEFEV